ncbi:MAG: methyltransferase domain-containing protein [Desulfomonile sp.]|nr:methyltransferase domain-containing protein [Desulfomonile sp.]
MWRRDTLASRLVRFLIPEKIPCFAARLYDAIAQTAVDTYYKEVAELVVAHMSRGKLLDIGTGPGYLPISIAKRAPEITIVGIDSSRTLLRIARENAERVGLSDRVKFMEGNGNRLEFGDNSWDMVISTGSFHAWKRPIRVIDECFRVLKAGGEAWLLDPAQVITPEALKMMERGLGIIDTLAYRWGSLTSKATPPYSREEIERIVRCTAFREGQVIENGWITVKLRKTGFAGEKRRS